MNMKLIAILFFVTLSLTITNSFAEEQITIQTDKDSYSQGDLIDLTGKVNGASNQLVAIEAKDSGGNSILVRTVQTDVNGNFELKFKIPSTAKSGSVNIVANAQVSGNTLTGSKTVSQSIADNSQSTSTTQKTSSPFGGRCLIATAAFGSELSPQVQFLRGFRDNHILATESGSSFMTVFNAWYYSFSPYVADYERQQPWLQQIVKTSIYPLLGILTISEKGFSSVQGDYGAVVAGSIASSMIGAVYFWPFALSVKQVRKNRFNYKLAVSLIGVIAISVVGSILSQNKYALMIATSLFVLTLLSVSAILVAKLIVIVKKKLSPMRTK